MGIPGSDDNAIDDDVDYDEDDEYPKFIDNSNLASASSVDELISFATSKSESETSPTD